MNSQDFKLKKEKSVIDNNWEKPLLHLLKQHNVRFLPYVPDAGHAGLISLSEQDKFIQPIVLTTEEEGIAFSSGSWLGGDKLLIGPRRAEMQEPQLELSREYSIESFSQIDFGSCHCWHSL